MIKRIFSDWIIPIGIAVVLALAINKFLVFKIEVPTGSMIPTIEEKEQFFVSRIYNTDKLKRGDIVVFFSKETNQRLVKRLIGLPGEEVVVDDKGTLYIDGQKIDEPYVKNTSTKGGTFKVPENSFLFLGDNRANSKDSRYWANPYISKEDIEGKVRLRIYPFNRVGLVK
jgi:signal peptidase I